jgi:hypothetical protein
VPRVCQRRYEVDTITELPRLNHGTVRLYFTKPWVPKLSARISLLIASIALGFPTHVTPVVDNTAFGVAPGKGCYQVNAGVYELIVRGYGGLFDTVDVDVPNVKAAADAAWTYAVGPMTTWQAFKRWVTGIEDPMDIDCVLAAVKVLNAGGVDVPKFRTPKGLYLWLKAKNAYGN